MYAWLAAINPRLSVEWYEACVRGDWDRAMEIQTMVNRFRYTTIETWGYQHPATIHKLNARLNPNIGCPLRVRPPYESGTEEDLRWARQWVSQEMPELLNM
jgi:dihydrodipicolinate synthase/N-acetylneuraminate lyase